MESAYSVVKKDVSKAVESAARDLGYDASDSISTIDVSKGFGDISCSIAFKIARVKKENPFDISNKIAAKIPKKGYIKSITTENGYLNFHLDRKTFSELVIHGANDMKHGSKLSNIGKSKRVIIEYPSANPMHPIHVGHLRNLVLGESVARLHDACGYDVERENFIQDLGLQMMMAVWQYMQKKAKPDKKFDHWIGELYAAANKNADSQEFKEQISKLTKLIEEGDTKEAKLAREIAEKCVKAQYETFGNYYSYQDVLIWESDILRENLLERAMSMLIEKSFLKKMTEGEYKGCVVLDLSTIKDLPDEFKGLQENIKVLIRNDGTPTYVAKDIAFHMWKFGMLEDTFKYSVFIDKQGNGKPVYSTSTTGKKMDFRHVSEAINIIDVKQNYPQALLKLSFKYIGRNDIADGIHHLSYGRVELENGTLAARKGISIENTADGLLEEAQERALALITERLKLSKEEQKKVSESVALSAIKFAFLRIAPEKWITFSWKWALNFEGESGPYCQYMYARATRLVEDSGMKSVDVANADLSVLSSENEFALVKIIAGLNDVVEKACTQYRPNLITEYAADLATSFGKFYESSPILKGSSESEKKARLALVFAFRSAMKTALEILGIEALEKM